MKVLVLVTSAVSILPSNFQILLFAFHSCEDSAQHRLVSISIEVGWVDWKGKQMNVNWYWFPTLCIKVQVNGDHCLFVVSFARFCFLFLFWVFFFILAPCSRQKLSFLTRTICAVEVPSDVIKDELERNNLHYISQTGDKEHTSNSCVVIFKVNVQAWSILWMLVLISILRPGLIMIYCELQIIRRGRREQRSF